MTFVWYQNGPRSKHVLVCEILVMSFATRLDLGLSLCSKTKKLSCWMVSIIYEHLCATNVWWCLYGLCWSYNGVSLVFGGGVVTLEVQWKCPHALAIVFYPSTLLQYQLLHTTLPTRFNHVPHIGNNGIEM